MIIPSSITGLYKANPTPTLPALPHMLPCYRVHEIAPVSSQSSSWSSQFVQVPVQSVHSVQSVQPVQSGRSSPVPFPFPVPVHPSSACNSKGLESDIKPPQRDPFTSLSSPSLALVLVAPSQRSRIISFAKFPVSLHPSSHCIVAPMC
jgi:hypothetical protein